MAAEDLRDLWRQDLKGHEPARRGLEKNVLNLWLVRRLSVVGAQQEVLAVLAQDSYPNVLEPTFPILSARLARPDCSSPVAPAKLRAARAKLIVGLPIAMARFPRLAFLQLEVGGRNIR